MHSKVKTWPEKTAGIWRRYHWFSRQMTSEKRAQKFHTDDACSMEFCARFRRHLAGKPVVVSNVGLFLRVVKTSCFCFQSSFTGSKGGAVVRALASHQCGLGSNPGVDALCGLSLLLFLSLAPRGFSPGTPLSLKPTLPNSIPSGTHGQVSTSS